MSHFEGQHLVNKFVAGKSEALSGQRLAKIGYKSTKANPAKYPSVCVSVPKITADQINGNDSRLIPHIIAMLETAQDGVIRSLYESSDGTLSSVKDTDISIEACINYLEAEAQGSRLTKEFLAGWFDSQLRDNLTIVFGQKLGFIDPNDDNPTLTEEQDKVIGQQLNIYRDLIGSLAGGKTILQEKQIKGLRTALQYVQSEDDISSKLSARLTAMEQKPKEIAEMLEL